MGSTVETFAEADPSDGAESEGSGLLDLAVTLEPGSEDAAVATTAGPSNAIVGNEALLSSTVTNNGPFAGPTTFTDTVPAGLTINAAAASGATCTTAGQTATCTTDNLAVGASMPVEIVVTPSSAQSYENTVAVADATGVTDPNPANNSASATLVVSAATITPSLATRECVATNVRGLSEKVVKRLLPSFGCKLGKIKKASSKSVAKGDVISLNPGSGAHAPGTKVTAHRLDRQTEVQAQALSANHTASEIPVAKRGHRNLKSQRRARGKRFGSWRLKTLPGGSFARGRPLEGTLRLPACAKRAQAWRA